MMKARNFKNFDGEPIHGHYFVSSIMEWKTGMDIGALVAHFKRNKQPFMIFWVPLPESESYKIDNFMPQVEGSIPLTRYDN